MRAGTTIAALQAELSLLTRRRRMQLRAVTRAQHRADVAQRQADRARETIADIDLALRAGRRDVALLRVERGEV